jgi:hypothetical protein
MALTYTHAPRPTAGPVTFTLAGDRLTVDSGRMVQEVRLGTVDLVRLTYEPRGLARTAFRTRLRLKDGKSFAFSSLSWRSMIDAEERAVEYRAFTRALLDAVAQANPQARFLAGRPRAVWAAFAALAAVALFGVALFVWRAVAAGATGAALLGGLVLALGIWQLEPVVRLNRPRRFRPDAPPAGLLP